jgi:hypothetical protein
LVQLWIDKHEVVQIAGVQPTFKGTK